MARLCLLVVLVALTAPLAAKEKRVPLPPLQDVITALANHPLVSSAVAVDFTLADSDQSCPGGEVLMVNGDQQLPVALDRRGSGDLNPSQLTADSELLLRKPDDAPPCTFGIGLRFHLHGDDQPLHYVDLMGLEAAYHRLVKAQSAVMSFMAPEFGGMVLVFDGDDPAQVVLTSELGSETLTTSNGEVSLLLDTDRINANPVVTFSRPPAYLYPLLQ